MARTRRFLREVTRRHVVPVTIGYSVAAWLIVQVASIVLPAFSAPIWGLRAVIVLAVLGFPMALVVAWLFDITPKGLVRTSDVDGVLPDLATQALPAPNPIVAERRQITVLHVHLKWAGLRGGTPDAEDLRGATSTFRGQVEKIAERYRAGIVRLNSHRMVLYFGFPEASENDARHAADAALAIVEGARTFTLVGAAVESIRVVARIGIDTDVAVVEAADGHRPEVVGNLTERAEWIQTLAPDEAIFLSPATQRLLAGYYEIRHVDNLQHDGAGAPLSIYQLVGEASQSRLEARGIFAQLIGRETELALLRQRWARMLEGGGEIVVVSGESGLGKSRLIHEFERVVAEDAPAVIQRLVCYADYRNSALYPVRRFFQKQLEDGLSSSDGETALVDSLERRLTAAGCDPTIAVPLMLEFLGRGQTPRYPEPQLSSTLRKTRTLEVLLALLLAPASQVPLLLLIDDFHWADPTFRELVQMIVSQGPGTRVLAILATRPEGIPEWITRAHISQISVGPLTTSETKALVSAIGESIGLPDGVVAKLAHNAQGNPLFAEELTRGVVERGDLKQLDSDSADIDDFEIPLTLQESLSAQLDRLPIGARVVARLAATIGREFSYEIIRAFAAGLDVSDFDASLVELVSAEIVYQKGLPPTATYSFRHVLVQDAAYKSILKREREAYHARIAALLTDRFAEEATKHPEILAHHLTLAGDLEHAVPEWSQAGRLASRAAAHQEACAHFRHALKLLGRLPASPRRDAVELGLQIALGPSLMATRGYSAPEVRDAYDRAEQLSNAAESTLAVAPAISGLWAHHVVAGNLTRAMELGVRLQSIAESSKDADLLLESHVLLGVTLSYIGPMEDSLRHLESASGMYVRERHAAHAYVYGQDPGMACVSYAAIPHWWLGFVVTAGQCVENAVSHARTLDHPRSLAFALANGARAQLKRGDYVRSAELGAEAADISGRHGFPDFLFMGSFHKLAAEHCATRDPDQIHAMHAALESLVEVGNSVSVPYYCSLVANALSENSQFEPAARLLDRADAILLKHGHDCDASEVCRARGLLQWRQGDPAAETVLRRAHDLAAREHGLSWRLQAATTLAKYLAQRNRAPDGRDMLRAALDAMPERAYLPIFNEAEALIDEL